MSGILGLVRLDGDTADPLALAPAMQALAIYGGDASGLWNSGPVALGSQLRRGAPESANERLPFTRGPLTITADARIDNRGELGAATGLTTGELQSVPDGELILRAYEKWGEGCAEQLVGDFAFAIWDTRNRSLYCARDHIGARPFFYYRARGVFAFATDIRGVLACPGVPAEIDEGEIARCLLTFTPGYHDNEHTFFTDLRKLPFGHWLVLADGRVRTGRHWRPEELGKVSLPSPEAYADRLFELVRLAVADRVRGEVGAVGAHLSGGLDSSSVAVLTARVLREQGRPRPTVYSWSPPPGEHPEETEHRRIRRICEQEGLTPIYLSGPSARLIWSKDADVATRPLLTMGREARVQDRAAAQGVRLLLSGWGGDEGVSFNGRGLAAEWLVTGRWWTLLRSLGWGDVLRHPRAITTVAKRIESAVLPCLPDVWFELLAYRGTRRRWERSCINPQLLARFRSGARPLGPPLREVPGVRNCQLRLYAHGHLTARIESWAVHGAERGLAYAYPLLDRRVLEFVYGVPGELHHRSGFGRWLYRHTMTQILPTGVPWDTVKEDSALAEAVGLGHADERDEMPGWWRGAWPPVGHPWVEAAALKRAQPGGRVAPQRAGSLSAVECLNIWQRWVQRH